MTRLKPKELEVILDKESASSTEMLTTIARQLVKHDKLFLPEELTHYCSGCGKRKPTTAEHLRLPNGIKTEETFCLDCLQKWGIKQ